MKKPEPRREYRVPYAQEGVDADRFGAMLEDHPIGDGIIVYGAGNHGLALCEYLERHGHPVRCFCDSAPEKQNRPYYGKPVISPAELFRDYNGHTVVISVHRHLDAIGASLLKGGISRDQILVPPFRLDSGHIAIPEDLVPADAVEPKTLFAAEETGKGGTFSTGNPRVTVHTSVYNVHERYLRRAIESVLGQSFPDFRYILFDNGSTDGSAEIIDEYAARDDRIVVFRSDKNLALASDLGDDKRAWILKTTLFDLVETPYFCALDSDDFYMPDFLETTCRLAEEYNADMVAGRTIMYSEENPHEQWSSPVPIGTGVYRGKREIAAMLCDFCFIWRVRWGRLIKSSLHKNVYAQSAPGNIGNFTDTFFGFESLFLSDTVVMIDKTLHHGTYRKHSVSRNISSTGRHLERSHSLYNWWMRRLGDIGAATEKNVAAVKLEVSQILRHEADVFRIAMSKDPDMTRPILDAAVAGNWFLEMMAVPEFFEILANMEALRKKS